MSDYIMLASYVQLESSAVARITVICYFPAKPSDHGKIINVDITPNPPQRGKAISIVANLTLGK